MENNKYTLKLQEISRCLGDVTAAKNIPFSLIRLCFIKYVIDNNIGSDTARDVIDDMNVFKAFAAGDAEGGFNALSPVLARVDKMYSLDGLLENSFKKYPEDLFSFDGEQAARGGWEEKIKILAKKVTELDLSRGADEDESTVGKEIVCSLLAIAGDNNRQYTKKLGEFVTKDQLAAIAGGILNVKDGETFLDFASGIGASTIKIIANADAAARNVERNGKVAAIAAMLYIMNGYKDFKIDIADGLEANPGRKAQKIFVDIPSVTPSLEADYEAVIKRAVECLEEGGTAVITAPNSVLYKNTNKYKALRKSLFENGNVNGVITLPPCWVGSANATNLLVITSARNEDILLIDAVKLPDGQLTDDSVQKLLGIFTERKEIEGVSKRVSRLDKNFCLQPSVYNVAFSYDFGQGVSAEELDESLESQRERADTIIKSIGYTKASKPLGEQTERMLSEFDGFVNLLNQIKQARVEGDGGFNFFFAAGMDAQEIRHSAFLAFLLDPNKNHGLGGGFLKLFLRSLYEYAGNGNKKIAVRPNRAIINDCWLGGDIPESEALAALERLCWDDKNNKTEVLREVVVNKNGEVLSVPCEDGDKGKKSAAGRIDILIIFPAAKTLVVIENKLYSALHDDQLKKYEDGLNASPAYKDYKKIFVYLRADGSLPLNADGGYNEKWCVYDYEAIRGIIGKIKDAANTNRKLQYILGDYMDIIDVKNLQGRDGLEARKKIRKFLGDSDNVELVKLILDYYNKDNDVFDYIYSGLKARLEGLKTQGKISGFTIVSGGEHGDKSVNFTLSGVEVYKIKHGVKGEMGYRIASNPYIGGFLVGFEDVRFDIQLKTTVDIPQSYSFLPEKDRGFADTSDPAVREKLDAALDAYLNIVVTADDIVKTL